MKQFELPVQKIEAIERQRRRFFPLFVVLLLAAAPFVVFLFSDTGGALLPEPAIKYGPELPLAQEIEIAQQQLVEGPEATSIPVPALPISIAKEGGDLVFAPIEESEAPLPQIAILDDEVSSYLRTMTVEVVDRIDLMTAGEMQSAGRYGELRLVDGRFLLGVNVSAPSERAGELVALYAQLTGAMNWVSKRYTDDTALQVAMLTETISEIDRKILVLKSELRGEGVRVRMSTLPISNETWANLTGE